MPLSAGLVCDLQVALNTAVKLENELKKHEKLHELKQVVKTAEKGITDAAGG